MPTIMTETDRRTILLETRAARDKAEALLQGLLEAKRETDQRLAEHDKRDLMEVATGESGLHRAIENLRAMIRTLDLRLEEALRDLIDDDLVTQDAAVIASIEVPQRNGSLMSRHD